MLILSGSINQQVLAQFNQVPTKQGWCADLGPGNSWDNMGNVEGQSPVGLWAWRQIWFDAGQILLSLSGSEEVQDKI